MKIDGSLPYRVAFAFGLAALTGCGASASGAQLKFSPSVPTSAAASPSMAKNFSGSWPLIVSRSKYSDGTYCLALTDDGSDGWRHSGPAVLDGKLDGEFQIIGGLIAVTINDGGFYFPSASVYSAPTRKGNIGSGAVEEIYGGESIDSGIAAFGMKGGCKTSHEKSSAGRQ